MKKIREIISTLLIFGLAALHSPSAQALTGGYQKTVERNQAYMEILVGQLRSVNQLGVILAMSGTKSGAVSFIVKDMKSKVGGDRLPKIGIKNTELFANGRPTGIKITSYMPLTMAYKGNSWTYDTAKPADENYRSADKFFSKQSIAFMDFLVPSAHATDHSGARDTGLAVGVVFSVMGCIGGVFGCLIGPFAGGVFYKMSYDYENSTEQSAINSFLNSKLQVQCEPNALITVSAPDGTKVVFTKGKKPSMVKAGGPETTLDTITETQTKRLEALVDCGSDPKAAQAEAQKAWEAGKEVVREAMASHPASDTNVDDKSENSKKGI